MTNDTKPDYFENPPPRRVGALVLLERDGEFAVIRRSYWTAISEYGLPGGSAEPNELSRRAANRLLAVKLGVRVSVGALIAVDHSPERPGWFHEGSNFIYHARLPPGQEIAVAASSGYTEAQWLAPEAIGELAIDHELLRIQQSIECLRTNSFKELLLGLPMYEQPSV
ncbi:NUDIX hydrolase [Streptomyces sp. NPDC057617]|uniref:NUDIX hydrolase n=1 Tax=Streptomyces sp. NPDC057617 TaxID=3346184 RepID=UPI00367EBC8B